VQLSDVFKLDLREDFPLAELEAVQLHLREEARRARLEAAWVEWAGACNGVLFRFLACDEHAAELAASLDESAAPPHTERYRQERLLFSMFTEGLSCVECLCYGLHFVGAMVDPAAFEPGIDPRDVKVGLVVRGYEGRFPDEDLTFALAAVNADPEMESWRNVRNVLSHRASPGRTIIAGDPAAEAQWFGEDLTGDVIRARRVWLGDTISAVLAPAVPFVREYVR
jgi:hypothetical protein